MRAAVMRGSRIDVETVPDPAPGPGQILSPGGPASAAATSTPARCSATEAAFDALATDPEELKIQIRPQQHDAQEHTP